MRPSLLWGIMRRRLVLAYRSLGTGYRSYVEGVGVSVGGGGGGANGTAAPRGGRVGEKINIFNLKKT